MFCALLGPDAWGAYAEHERPEDAGGEFPSMLRYSILLPADSNLRGMERKFDANRAGRLEKRTAQEDEERKNILATSAAETASHMFILGKEGGSAAQMLVLRADVCTRLATSDRGKSPQAKSQGLV